MYKNVFGLPARPAALMGAATAVAAGALALGPASLANASDGPIGKSSATTARVALDVALQNPATHVPVNKSLNAVHAPEDSSHTLLTAKVPNVNGGKPTELVKADVGTSKATANAEKSEGYANLVDATVHLPGLPVPSTVHVKQVTSKATCVTGEKPKADSELLGTVEALGKQVSLSASGEADVDAPGVGKAHLSLSKEETTSNTATATALKLNVTVEPANLNVGKVTGEVVLVEATCEAAGGDGGSTAGSGGGSSEGSSGGDTDGATAGSSNGSTGGSASAGGGDSKPGDDLAETGAGSTLAIGGVAAALIAGGTVLVVLRRRSNANRG